MCLLGREKGMARIGSIGVFNGETFMGARKAQRRRVVRNRSKNLALADDRACQSEIARIT
jgi:hypothetical protein